VGNETLIGMKKCENRGADDSHVLRCAMPRQDLSLTNLEFWELRDVRTRWSVLLECERLSRTFAKQQFGIGGRCEDWGCAKRSL